MCASCGIIPMVALCSAIVLNLSYLLLWLSAASRIVRGFVCPPPPPSSSKMVFAVEFAALLEKAWVPVAFLKYLEPLGVEDALTFALMVDSERPIKSELIAESGVEMGVLDVVAVTKAWLLVPNSRTPPQ